MATLPKSIQNLINEFSKLPGVGPKSASRLTFYLLKQQDLDLDSFSKAVNNLKKDITTCSTCFNMTDTNPCRICSDSSRNHNLICVVEDAMDVVAMDQIEDFNGVFHVLGGVISPLDGVGPDNLTIKQLLERIANAKTDVEAVLATNPSMEGEATAMYITRELKKAKYSNVKITRLGRGLPMGADLEYADEHTLSQALAGRSEL